MDELPTYFSNFSFCDRLDKKATTIARTTGCPPTTRILFFHIRKSEKANLLFRNSRDIGLLCRNLLGK
jgi:hypothetical protein